MRQSFPLRALALFLLLFTTTTCGDDGVEVEEVASVTVSPGTFELAPGETQQLTVVVADAGGAELPGRTVTFSSSNHDVATVDPGNGLVTAVAEGQATITAESEGVQGTAQVTVTPPPVASVVVEPATADLEIDETVQLEATLEDADGNELTDRSVTWSSSAAEVATVDDDGLVTAEGGGTATITAEAEGVEGTAEITVALPDFTPEEDREIEGTPSFGDFVIPAGVTVTVTGPLEVEIAGDVELAGTLTGDCHPITLRSAGGVTVSGTVSNECVTEPDAGAPGDLRIIAGTGYQIDGATLTTSGDGEVTNDETLTDDDFPLAGPLPTAPRQAAAGECPVQGEFLASPGQATSGSGGVTAEAGGHGSTWTLRCQGNMTVSGETVVTAQDGGDGGDGASDTEGEDEARGGDGGDGGDVRVQATGDIDLTADGGGMTLRLTRGGQGGAAVRTAAVPGGDATATGGNGGNAGSFRVQAGGDISVSPGGLTIEVGSGGNGGPAEATAADGEDAGEEAATAGGDASATGGTGGDTPEGHLQASGSVSGLANVVVTGGHGGLGGAATAYGGRGGDGNQEFPAGADGGSIAAVGGAGGSSLTGDQDGTIIGTGGDGGHAFLSGGVGGTGWNGCSVDPVESGGVGGAGGTGSGSGGAPGTGNPDGVHGNVTVAEATGNGGPGGDGEDEPGAGGPAGDGSGIDPADGERIDEGENFQEGADGGPCATPEEVKTKVMPSSVSSSSAQVPPGDYTASLRAEEGAGDEVAQMTVTAAQSDNAVDADNEQFLSVGPSYWGFDLSSIVGVAGAEVVETTSVEVCHPEPSSVPPAAAGPLPITEAQPLEIVFYNVTQQIVATYLLTQVGACTLVPIPAEAVFLRLLGPEGVVIYLEVFILTRMLLGI